MLYRLELLDLFELYLKEIKLVAPTTVKAYKHDIINLLNFLEKNSLEQVKDIRNSDILFFLESLKQKEVSAARLARIISSLKVFWSFLANKYQVVSCVDGLVSPRVTYKLPVYCSPENIVKLIGVCDKDISLRGVRNGLLLRMLYYTGAPLQALVLIKKEEVFLSSQEFLVKSSIGVYSLPMAGNFYKVLKDYLEKCDFFLFPIGFEADQKPLSAQAAWSVLNKLLLNLDLSKKVSPRSVSKAYKLHDALDKAREMYDKNHPRS